jgi:hypothetical protein
MGIRDFIRDQVFADSLQKRGVLVVYDAERRYRDLCRSMAGDLVTVVDASDSSIESRQAAMKALPGLVPQGENQRGLLIYVPTHAPLTDEAKHRSLRMAPSAPSFPQPTSIATYNFASPPRPTIRPKSAACSRRTHPRHSN